MKINIYFITIIIVLIVGPTPTFGQAWESDRSHNWTSNRVGIGVDDPASFFAFAGLADLAGWQSQLHVFARNSRGILISGEGINEIVPLRLVNGGRRHLIGAGGAAKRYNLLLQSSTGIIFNTDGDNERLRITNDGKLRFTSDLNNRKIILWDGGRNNNHNFYGFGVTSNVLRYQVNTIRDSHVFYAGLNNGSSRELMRIQGDGKVLVGTSYVPEGYLMGINGKLLCEELTVQLRGNWPDYVFRDDYDLMELEKLEEYICENGHLPGVQSSVEVEEAGGVDVGESQRVLLEKVEELTLYMIQLDKENQGLLEKIELLEANINN